MKVNIQKTKNRFISILGAVCVFVSCMVVPAMAADSNNNEFVDFNDYSEYTFAEDNSAVTVDVSFPSEWNITFIDFPDAGLGDNWYLGNEIYIEGLTNPWRKINMHPMGGRMTWDTNVGHQIANCHFLDLRYIPKGTTLTYEFNLSISTYDINIEEQIFTRYFFFVDESGKVIDRKLHYFDPVMNGNGSYTWSENIDVSTFPSGAVGLVPMFVVRNLESAFSDVMVYLSSFELVIPMSALEFQNVQNEQLKATLKNVQAAQEELLNGTPEQNQQAQDAVNGLNNSTDKLGELGDTMASVEKPSIDSSKISADSLVPQTSLVVLSAPFQVLWENKQLLAMLSIVVTLVLVSWVFFGKKA